MTYSGHVVSAAALGSKGHGFITKLTNNALFVSHSGNFGTTMILPPQSSHL